MKQYLRLLRHVREHGMQKADRTGAGTLSVFGYQMRFDLAAGFPLVTTKHCHLKSIIYELLWFLRGDTNIKYLNDHGVTIWDEWADANGDLGPIYGAQWRKWQAPDGRRIDQLEQLLAQIKTNPDSRRLLLSAWNVADIGRMALAPCHVLAQLAGLKPGELVHTFGNAHIYLNHLAQVDEQLKLQPYPLPEMRINPGPPTPLNFSTNPLIF